MVKFFAGDGIGPPRRDMALGATFSQIFWRKFSRVRALMAIFASLRLEVLPFINANPHGFRRLHVKTGQVTLCTFELFVFAINFVMSVSIVIEIVNLLPIPLVVAILAAIGFRQQF